MLQPNDLARCLQAALATGGDFAEIYLEDKDELNIRRNDGTVQGVSTVRIHGAGIHLLLGTRSVYVFTCDTAPTALLDAAKQAATLLRMPQTAAIPDIAFSMQRTKTPNPIVLEPASVPHQKKIAVLREANAAARDTGVGLRQLNLHYFDTDQRITVANSEGLYTQDRRVASRLRVQATVEEGGASLSEWDDFTRPQGFEAFYNQADYTGFASHFLLDLRDRLRACGAPSCVVPVVFEAGCGTLWHEACGHMLEAAAIAGNASPFAGKLGETIASDKVTLVDDGSIPGLYGSAAIDDEGHPTQKNILIENGVLKGYLCDRFQGRRIGMTSTGSGRRQSYTFAPTSRMTNTYLDAGNDDDAAILTSVPEGLFVKKLGGGNSGREFSIAVSEGYWIKNGQIDRRVKGLSLNGSGAELIRRVDRVGKTLQYEESGGYCGAASGLVAVTAFQPRMRISEMAVAGEG